jgi:hypothetical protein
MLVLMLMPECGGHSNPNPSTISALSPSNVNLVFVVSPDLAYQTSGDIQPDTANLTSQGLQRSLMMATYLKQQVLGGKNVTSIYALEPMTHIQTANNYPDMTAIGFIQHFALLNQFTLPVNSTGSTYTAYSYPINAAYGSGSVPNGTVAPASYCPDCHGLDFNDNGGNNVTLVNGIITANVPGFYVFSAPWETISALMINIDQLKGYHLTLPSSYAGTNQVYAMSITPSGNASLEIYNSELNPPSSYPVLPSPLESAACTHALQPFFNTSRTGGLNGVVIPANINTNERIYIVRHAEAHPDPGNKFEDGNFAGAGQWRALDLANVLNGKISPNMVYSIDPSQWIFTGVVNISYVRPSLTVLPYVIANNLPYHLVSDFYIADTNQAQLASDFFFTGGKFSNQTILLAWESSRIKPLINALLNSYGGNSLPLLPTTWPSTDYDTIWTVTLDAQGNVTVDNELCEGIDSVSLPEMSPQF